LIEAHPTSQSTSAEVSTQANDNKPLKTEVRPKDGGVMVYVPAGEFPMGSSDAEIAIAKADCPGCPEDWFDGERPQHPVYLDAYWIDRYEVTNAQFAKFIEDGGYYKREFWTEEGWGWKTAENQAQPIYWDEPRWNKSDHPVVGIAWFEALAYCRWAGARLPTEAEWERAAGWDADRQVKYIYPWGNKWDPARANTVESALGTTTPVGHYCPEGASPVGACDMVGNVWEWVSSIYMPYPYRPDYGREDWEAHGTRALRGGSWLNERDRSRTAYRLPPFPGDFILFDPTNGFRCAMSDQ
jgi:formylglycine-generating enzyme required for sulfatase activity